MTQRDAENPSQALQDAIAAFDAANLAWGQFYQQTWAARSEADRRRAEPVRQALGDAALHVPAVAEPAALAAFAAALWTAYERMREFINEAPAGVDIELAGVPGTLREAAGRLEPSRR